MPTVIRACDRLDSSGGRRTTRMAGNSVQQVAGSAAPRSSARRGLMSQVMRHAALALSLWLAACAAPSTIAPPPYHAPADADLGHAGGRAGAAGCERPRGGAIRTASGA